MSYDGIAAGQSFGRLRVLDEAEPYVWRGQVAHRRWICVCACGSQTEVRNDSLSRGVTRSCGCLRDDETRERARLHGGRAGGRRSPEYNAWEGMIRRSRAPVCRRWRPDIGRGFEAFLADMGPRPSPAHRLVRRDASRPYSPANCRWAADVPRQGVPRRVITYRGRQMTLKAAASAAGVGYALLCKRLERGWPERRALSG
ncbi:MAG TPA: hypothetical protein VE684_06580 [Crenalkalicoccus sp.]|nr:hypothetical protein [Crenalkalicoccus sp.]